MGQSFSPRAISKQDLPRHLAILQKKGYIHAEIKDEGKRKLHDIYDDEQDIWIECKTDYSDYLTRFLIEYKANVPLSLVEDLPIRYPLPYLDFASRFAQLPEKYNSLSTDVINLEPKHLLSYGFDNNKTHYLMDLRQLRQTICGGSFDFMVVGYEGDSWRSVVQIVPIAQIAILK